MGSVNGNGSGSGNPCDEYYQMNKMETMMSSTWKERAILISIQHGAAEGEDDICYH